MRVYALVERADDLALVRHGLPLGQVVALGAGDGAPLTDALAEARALGAVRAVRVTGELLQRCDYLGTAHVLGVALRHLGGDLAAPPTVILAGDRGRNAVGPAVAERLGLPHLGRVVGLSTREGQVVAHRSEPGVIRLFSAAAPVLLCLSGPPAAAEAARVEPSAAEVLALETLGLTVADLQHRRHFQPAPCERDSLRPQPVSDPAALVDRLRKEGLLRARGGA